MFSLLRHSSAVISAAVMGGSGALSILVTAYALAHTESGASGVFLAAYALFNALGMTFAKCGLDSVVLGIAWAKEGAKPDYRHLAIRYVLPLALLFAGAIGVFKGSAAIFLSLAVAIALDALAAVRQSELLTHGRFIRVAVATAVNTPPFYLLMAWAVWSGKLSDPLVYLVYPLTSMLRCFVLFFDRTRLPCTARLNIPSLRLLVQQISNVLLYRLDSFLILLAASHWELWIPDPSIVRNYLVLLKAPEMLVGIVTIAGLHLFPLWVQGVRPNRLRGALFGVLIFSITLPILVHTFFVPAIPAAVLGAVTIQCILVPAVYFGTLEALRRGLMNVLVLVSLVALTIGIGCMTIGYFTHQLIWVALSIPCQLLTVSCLTWFYRRSIDHTWFDQCPTR